MRHSLVLFMFLAACGPKSSQATETEVPAPSETPASVDLDSDDAGAHSHMEEHFEVITQARDVVIGGDIEAARASLTWLAEHEAPARQLPEGWPPYVDAMKAAAQEASSSETRVALAQGIARTAAICGRCHRDFKTGPTYGAATPAAGGLGARQHMHRHQWAADRMWEGLIASDTERWVQGAEVMREAHLENLEGGSVGEIQALAVKVHELGATALHTIGPDQQALLYAEFIATCGTCHRALAAGPTR